MSRCAGLCGGERLRDPRLAPWWTGRSVRRRLLAHLTEQAGSTRISPGGHRRIDLVLERVVVWSDCVCVSRGAGPRKQRRSLAHMHFGNRDEGGGVAATNAVCIQDYQKLCTSDYDVLICSCRNKIGAELHIYLEEGSYHKRLFRGPSTNDMKK